ncbi:MAG: hypothetical protein IJI43_00025 [Bacilli bacterium]|nr:hypothetical protein [Bacilli bacterium]
MKRFFKGLGSLLWRHKLLSLISLLAFAAIVILMYIFFSVFLGGTDKYGGRLNGIEDVKITKKEITSIENWIKDTKTVEDVSIRVVGKIVYFDVTFNKDADINGAKNLASSTLEKFDNDKKEFYDFEYILSQNVENGFKVTGTKSPKIDKVSWIKS